MYTKFLKRLIDIILSDTGLIVLAIPMGIFALLINRGNPGAVLFKEKRVGKNKKYFNLYKFRSMKMDTPHAMPTHMLENSQQYILSLGAVIRKTSIDELPQM